MADNPAGWEAALTELAASSALLEKLEERTDAGSRQVVEALQIAHGRLRNLLTDDSTAG